MGFKSSITDPDLWIRPSTKADGEQYYEFILMYVDDILAISQDAVSEIREFSEKFKFKKDKMEPPEIYLGGILERKGLNGNQVWEIRSTNYVTAVAKNLEQKLKKQCVKLSARAITIMSSDYRPELDATAEIDANDINMFQGLIGELIWAT